MIRVFYMDQTARRSRVPLINHIHEGLKILEYIGASLQSQEAFCVHPIIQADHDLRDNYQAFSRYLSSHVVMLVMEYRSVANSYLSHHEIPETGIRLSPLIEVNQMLIADKVQNMKDFQIYHENLHPKSNRLKQYFQQWFDVLGVSREEYERLADLIR